MSRKNKQLKLGAILSYIGIILGIVTGVTYHPWMIRTIGDSDYGLYTLAMSLINTFLIDFGLGMAAQRYIAYYRAQNNEKEANNIAGMILRLYGYITIVLLCIFSIIFFLLEDIYLELTALELRKFQVLYIMATIYSVTTFPFVALNGILNAHEKFVPLKIAELIHKVLTVILTALALIMGQGVYVLVVINLISSIIYTMIRIWCIRMYTPIKPNFRYYRTDKAKALLFFSIWTSISTMSVRLLLSLAPSILGIVSNSYEIAVFGYAVSVEGHIYSFVNAINGFFMPRLSVISLEENELIRKEKVLNLMVLVGRYILLLFSLIFVGFAVLGKEFINLLVGTEYERAYLCVLLICGYGIISYPQQIANTYTVVQNKVKMRALASITSLIIYGPLALIFGRTLGAIGISLAVCISLLIQTIFMNVVFYKVLGIDIFRFFKSCHLKLLPGLSVFVVISMVITNISLSGWIGFWIKGGLIVITYMISIWFLILNEQEKKIIFKRFKRDNKDVNHT